MSSDSLAIFARGIEKRFGHVAALRGIDLELPFGRSLGILGPNGAGKSTLVRILAGLSRPTAGQLRIAGEEKDRRRVRGRVGLLSHATLLYPALSARENLRFTARLYGVEDAQSRIDTLLEELALTAAADRRVDTLSRGMAQRVAIARALLHQPPLLLLDEPFTGLDVRSAEELEVRIRAVRDAGRSVVLVSHDIERICACADRVLVISQGRVVHTSENAALDPAQLRAVYDRAAEASA